MYPYNENYCDFQRLLLIWGVHTFGKGGSQGGGSRKEWFTGGSQKGGFTGGSRKGGFTGGFTKRGVHVNPVNPPGYGPVYPLMYELYSDNV